MHDPKSQPAWAVRPDTFDADPTSSTSVRSCLSTRPHYDDVPAAVLVLGMDGGFLGGATAKHGLGGGCESAIAASCTGGR